MQKRVITLSREFGSGGRTIAHRVAERLGYAYYDQELILKVAKESGLAEQIVEKYDEYATHKNSLLYALALSAGAGAGGTLSFVSKVQQAQAKIITDLANKGSCVIVGRGGDYVCATARTPSTYLSTRIWSSARSASFPFTATTARSRSSACAIRTNAASSTIGLLPCASGAMYTTMTFRSIAAAWGWMPVWTSSWRLLRGNKHARGAAVPEAPLLFTRPPARRGGGNLCAS